ncbi:MAG TPA: aminotransferase class I/II-fold pyridoxal phosphate-dependent enzyme [Ktedonobacterales bacterium]|nr:aminotransferase class I/II-fold pyridoxal phosphate-dependent enzyme [Ktedonobacterales bacterium]
MSTTRAHRTTTRHGGARTHVASSGPTGEQLRLAPASRTLAPSPTLEINEAIAARRAAGRDVLHLGFGEASFPLPPKLREALAASATRTSYEPVVGIPALRDAIARYLSRTRGLDVSAEQVIVAPGSKPLLYALFLMLAGDVLAPAPAWVSYAPQARLAGRRVLVVETDPEDAHRLTPRALDAAVARGRHAGADPRILIINSPSNPTGGMFAREDVEALAEWARRTGVTVLSDEIYAELAHGWRSHVSLATFYPEGTVVTGGLSKTYSAGGWRLGYAVVPAGAAGRKLLSALRALSSEIWSSTSAPIQAAAVTAFSPDADLETYVRRSARLHGYTTGRLRDALVEMGVRCPRPAGAFYLYPDFAPFKAALAARGVTTSEELARYLLERHDIAALPGTAFGDRPAALRLRLATSMLYGGLPSVSPAQQGAQEGHDLADEHEARLWALLERADGLADPISSTGSVEIELPMLDRVGQRFAAFVESLGSVGASS